MTDVRVGAGGELAHHGGLAVVGVRHGQRRRRGPARLPRRPRATGSARRHELLAAAGRRVEHEQVQPALVGRLVVHLELHHLRRVALEDAEHGEALQRAGRLARPGEHDDGEAVELVGEALHGRRRAAHGASALGRRRRCRCPAGGRRPGWAASAAARPRAGPGHLGRAAGGGRAALVDGDDADDQGEDDERRDGRDDAPPAALAPRLRGARRRLEVLLEAAPALAGEVGVRLLRRRHRGADLRADQGDVGAHRRQPPGQLGVVLGGRQQLGVVVEPERERQQAVVVEAAARLHPALGALVSHRPSSVSRQLSRS